MGRGGEGVHAGVGHGAVTALALDLDVKVVCRRGADAGGGDHHGPGGEGHIGHHMDHQRGVHFGVFQKACFNHVFGALKNLLCRLEHQLDGALDPVLVLLQQSGRAQEHGGVHIVAAGVHPAVFAGKVHVRLLTDGQAVHVRPEQKHLARLLPAGQGHKSGPAAVFRRIAHVLQLFFYIGQGFSKVKFRPGHPVKGAPLVYYGFADVLRFGEKNFRLHLFYLHRDYSFFLSYHVFRQLSIIII